MIPPFLLKEPPAIGVWDSYREIIERVDSTSWQLHLYNFPRLSGVPITMELVASLREFHSDLVVGVKDSSGDIRSLHSFLTVPEFSVMPGTEHLLAEGVRMGAAGVITATANVNASGIDAVYRELVGGSFPDDTRMLAVREVIDRFGPIPAMKAALAHRTGYAGWNRLRPALVPLIGEIEMNVSSELEALTN